MKHGNKRHLLNELNGVIFNKQVRLSLDSTSLVCKACVYVCLLHRSYVAGRVTGLKD